MSVIGVCVAVGGVIGRERARAAVPWSTGSAEGAPSSRGCGLSLGPVRPRREKRG
jgi:hypothetical protein